MNRTAQHPLLRVSNLLVHCFARSEWQQIDGGKWKSSGGRVLSSEAYQRHQQRLKDRGGKSPGAKKPKATEQPAPAQGGGDPAGWPKGTGSWATAAPAPSPGPKKRAPRPAIKQSQLLRSGEPSEAENRKAYAQVKASGQKLAGYRADVDYTRPMGQTPVKAPALSGGQKLPDPSPADSAYINRQHGKDTQRFGAKVANFLRSATAGAVGILTATNGLAWGAIAGSALGGPLGLALGTAIGGGIGGKLGAWAGKKILTEPAGAAVAKGGTKKPPAARDNKRKAFAEPGAAPPNLDPVALIKARIRALLASQGKPSNIEIDDEPILAALALAAQGEGAQEQGAALAQMAESVRDLVRISRRVCRA